jgi:microtubule-associated protein, RP/EB family
MSWGARELVRASILHASSPLGSADDIVLSLVAASTHPSRRAESLTPTPGPASTRGRTPIGGGRVNQSAELQALQTQVAELTTHLEGLEKERDFYFAKLRDIEILVQQQMETLEAEGKEDKTLKEIQAILYSTEVSMVRF